MRYFRSAKVAAAFIFVVLLTPGVIVAASSKPDGPALSREIRQAPSKAAKERAVKTAQRSPSGASVGTARIRLLGVNDFHGHLESPGAVGGRPVGGAAHVAAYLDHYSGDDGENTIRVHAGDMVGASPLVSSHFHDEPSVEAMNLMSFDVGVLGNHEFDQGADEMLRLISGGGREEEPETSARNFPGANFPYLAANVVDRRSGESVLPPYEIIERGGVRVGFIGVVTPETTEFTAPEIEDSFEFLDLSETVNRYARDLRERGVEAVVVLAHSGGSQTNGVAKGEIMDETAQMADDGTVDVVFAGHTHNYVNARVGGEIVVVEGGKYGEAISVVDLEVDRASGEVSNSSARLVNTYNDAVRPNPEVRGLVEEHAARVAPLAERVVGAAAREITATAASEAGESALGDLIADAGRARTNADFAFFLTDAIRGGLDSGELTYGDLSAAYPGTNDLVTVDLTGEQIREVLESQYREGADRILQVSGLRFSRDPSRPLGDRVTSITLPDGTPLDPDETYTVATGEFIARGGNGFDVFERGANPQSFGTELDAFARHIESLPQPFEAPDPNTEQRMRLD